jgi:hypothetical protein
MKYVGYNNEIGQSLPGLGVGLRDDGTKEILRVGQLVSEGSEDGIIVVGSPELYLTSL